MYSSGRSHGCAVRGCPIRRPSDQSVFAAPRSLSQLAASFVALRCQGIRHAPLYAWPERTLSRPRSPGRPYKVIKNFRFVICDFRLTRNHKPINQITFRCVVYLLTFVGTCDFHRSPSSETIRFSKNYWLPAEGPGMPARAGKCLRRSFKAWEPWRAIGGRDWNRTSDLVLIRDAL